MSQDGYFTRRLRSFRFAFAGLAKLLGQPNARVHALATLLVAAAGAFAGLAAVEWALVTLAATVVWLAEAFNTALERLADAAVPERHPLVGTAKDLAAGGVLVSAIGAAIVAALVFVPRLAAFFD